MAEQLSLMKKQIAQLETDEAADKYFADQANFLMARRKIETIDNFNGVFDFLNNEYPCDVFYEGIVYPSVFHGMQGGRAQQEHDRKKIALAETMQELYELASQIDDPPNWTVERLVVMEKLLRDKFRRNRELRDKLIKTGNRTLINTYADRTVSNLYWGMVDGKGENHVGKLLEAIRLDAHTGKDLHKWFTMLLRPVDDKALIPNIKLEVYKDASKLEDVVVQRKPYVLMGVLPENDIPLAHPSISRQHCSLLTDALRGVVCVDLSSKAGTFLNGERIESFLPVTVKDGDWLAFAESTRKYMLRIDYRDVQDFLRKRERSLELDMKILSLQSALPSKDEQVRAGLGLVKHDTIYVWGLPDNCSEKEVRDAFDVHGKILAVRMPVNPSTGKSKNIAFVKYADDQAAKKAIEVFNVQIRDKLVKVTFAEQDKRQVLNELERKVERGKHQDAQRPKDDKPSHQTEKWRRRSRSSDRKRNSPDRRQRRNSRERRDHRDRRRSRRRSSSGRSSDSRKHRRDSRDRQRGKDTNDSGKKQSKHSPDRDDKHRGPRITSKDRRSSPEGTKHRSKPAQQDSKPNPRDSSSGPKQSNGSNNQGRNRSNARSSSKGNSQISSDSSLSD